MALVFMDNVCVNITRAIDRNSLVLPLGPSDKAYFVDNLGEDDYTYFTLTTRLGAEIVRIYVDNGVVRMDRAQGGSEPLAASSGSCLCFKINKLILDEYVTGIQEPCRPTIVSDDLEITPPEEDECEWTINFTEEFKDRLDICCPEGNCPECGVTDGTYENATVTIRNGRICEISNGRNIVYTGGSCCNCSNDEG